MSNKDRLPVFPSRASQLQMKARLANAQRGYSLLRKKSDALQFKNRQILKKFKYLNDISAAAMKKAMFSLTEAKFTGVDFGQLIFQEVDKARVRVRVRDENIAGVYLCVLDVMTQSGGDTSLVGLGRGGQQIANVRQQFFAALEIFVSIAQMQSAIQTLARHIRLLNRRINSIQYVIVPCIVRTLDYISTEMDEYEREEFYRLKKIQNSKRHSWLSRSREAADRERQAVTKSTVALVKNVALTGPRVAGGDVIAGCDISGGGDEIFDKDADDDIIF